jgi:hypothetical protein
MLFSYASEFNFLIKTPMKLGSVLTPVILATQEAEIRRIMV